MPEHPALTAPHLATTTVHRPALRHMLTGISIGMVTLLILVACLFWLRIFSLPVSPLQADAHTVYLANSAKGLDYAAIESQWQWKHQDGGNEIAYLFAPYQPSGGDLEIEAQLKETDGGMMNLPPFGVVIGINYKQLGINYVQQGYFCGHTGYPQSIAGLPWNNNTLPNETTSSYGEGFTQETALTVTVHHNVITLFENGNQVAQDTAPDYDAKGNVGLYVGSAILLYSFRIEQYT